MTIDKIKKRIGLNAFTSEMILPILNEEYSFPTQKLSRLVKNGEILRLKKGVYVIAPEYRTRQINPIAVANLLHQPSYVSFEYALSYHGMIPERVTTITSATLGRSKEYRTPIGNYSFTKIPPKAYPLGLDWKYDDKDGGYMVATAEKALCDTIYVDKRVTSTNIGDIESYLIDDLRIDEEELNKLNSRIFWKLSMSYHSTLLRSIASYLKKRN